MTAWRSDAGARTSPAGSGTHSVMTKPSHHGRHGVIHVSPRHLIGQQERSGARNKHRQPITVNVE